MSFDGEIDRIPFQFVIAHTPLRLIDCVVTGGLTETSS